MQCKAMVSVYVIVYNDFKCTWNDFREVCVSEIGDKLLLVYGECVCGKMVCVSGIEVM